MHSPQLAPTAHRVAARKGSSTPRKPRAPRRTSFPDLPAASDPLFWVAVLHRTYYAQETLKRQLAALWARKKLDPALCMGLHAGLHGLSREVNLAVEQLQFQGRLLMAVPA